MKRTTLLSISIIALLVSFFLLNSCDIQDKTKYKIGIILPLTGSRANAGNDARTGIELAMSEISKSKPTLAERIELVFEDNASMPRDSVAAFNKLTQIDGVKIIIGPLASSTALACVPLANDSGTLLYLPTSSSPKLSGAGKYIFRSGILSTQQAEKAAKYAFSILGKKIAAIFYLADDTGEGYRAAFTDNFEKLGGRIVIQESYLPSDSNFRSQIVKIYSASPEIIYIPSTARSLAFILNQLKELGIDTLVISNFGIEGNDLISIAKGNADGILFTSIPLDPLIANEYKNKHGKELNIVSALCYDALMSIVDSIDATGSYDPAIISAYLRNKNIFLGITGAYSFNDMHDTLREMIIKTVKNGEFIIHVYEK